MELFNEISKYIFLLGSVQGFLLSFLILKKKENRVANLLLGILIIAFSLDLLEGFYFAGKFFYKYPHLLGITFGFPYLYGPLIYLYIITLTSQDKNFLNKYLLHFLPFVIVIILSFFELYLESADYKIALAEEKAFNIYGMIISMLIPVHGVIYTYFSIKEVGFFNRKLKRSFSNIENINLEWLAYIVFATMIIWSIVIIAYVFTIIYGEEIRAEYFIYIAISIFIYSMGYKGLKQPAILFETSETLNEINKDKKSYEKSGLNIEKAEKYIEELKDLFENQKFHRNSELTLLELANKLSISTHNLSEIFNTQLNKTFYDFVNFHRVEDVKDMIKKGAAEKFSLISLAFDAGFSSKSTFNTTFKKFTGLTPTQYREKVKEKEVKIQG